MRPENVDFDNTVDTDRLGGSILTASESSNAFVPTQRVSPQTASANGPRPIGGAMAHDLIIKNGNVIDGSGLPGFHGDIAVSGGRITDVGKVSGNARQV